MKIILVAHNIRSTHNVGAFFRTCDGLGIDEILFSGYTPHPTFEGDTRLPYFADKITRQIHKTALGAESTVNFKYYETLEEIIDKYHKPDTALIALEQDPNSSTPEQVVKSLKLQKNFSIVLLILGNEIHGVPKDILKQAEYIMEIPMHGHKESLNVSVATGIALYQLKSV